MMFRTYLLFVFLLSLYNVHGFVPIEWLQAMPSNLGFSWGNCGPASDPLQLKTLKISPDPIKVPGNITVDVIVAITSALPTAIRASLNLQKKVGAFYIKVPCQHDVGSCNYGNVCEQWSEFCTKYLEKYGFPCQCPIAAGTYSVPGVVIDETKKIPSEANGEFKLRVDISGNSSHLACFDFNFKLSG